MIVFQYVFGFSADRWRDDAEATAVQSLLSRLFFLIYFDFLRLFALGKGQTHLSEEQKKIMAVDADKDRLRSTLSLSCGLVKAKYQNVLRLLNGSASWRMGRNIWPPNGKACGHSHRKLFHILGD
jgi:hypothetical protein